MKVRDAYRVDTIEIINSIPEGELQTARRLSEDVKDLRYNPTVMQFPVNLHCAFTSAEFRALLSQLADYAEKNDSWPLIHIESHGDVAGIQLANGDYVRWTDLQPLFLRLNKATRNHLFIVLAACFGFHGIKAMLNPSTSAFENVASLRMLIGPAKESESGNLEDAMRAFYTSLLKTGNVFDAVMAVHEHEPTFRGYTAEEPFLAGWHEALKKYPVTNKARQQKAEKVLKLMRELSKPVPEKPYSETKTAIKFLNKNGPFEMHKRKFFMLDLFPELEEELTGVTLPIE